MNTTDKNVLFLNNFQGGIPGCGTIVPKTVNRHDL